MNWCTCSIVRADYIALGNCIVVRPRDTHHILGPIPDSRHTTGIFSSLSTPRRSSVMATGTNKPEEIQKGVKELEREITCPVCHDHFQEPKILPCCHYYCKGCVQALVRRAGPSQPFPCPECRSDTFLPQNDPDQLPTAFFVNRLKELYTCLLYTSPSPRDATLSRMPSSA